MSGEGVSVVVVVVVVGGEISNGFNLFLFARQCCIKSSSVSATGVVLSVVCID